MVVDNEKHSKALSYALQHEVEDRLARYIGTFPYGERENFKSELIRNRAPIFSAEAQWLVENEKLAVKGGEDTAAYEQALLYYYGAQLAEYEWLEQRRAQFEESNHWIMAEEEVYTPLILLHRHLISADGDRAEQATDFVRYAALLEQPPFVGYRAQDMSHAGFNVFFTLMGTERRKLEHRERKSKEPDKNIYTLLLQVQDWLNALVKFNYERVVTNELPEHDALAGVIRACNQDKGDKNKNVFGRTLRSLGILDDSRHMIYAFRQFRDRAENGHGLYRELSDSMIDFFELYLPPESMVTIDDVQYIRDETYVQEESDFQEDEVFTRIGNDSKAIPKPFRMQLREEYAIDPNTVLNWYGFQKPSELYVLVPRNQTRITIKLVYRGEDTDEQTDFSIALDYEQKAFDWSIFDKPSGASCVDTYKDCMRLTESVVHSMSTASASSRQAQTVFKQPKRTEPNDDLIYYLRRSMRQNSSKPSPPAENGDANEAQRMQFKPIIINENILQDLHPDLVADIRHAVNRFNQRQQLHYVGFKKLETFVDTFSFRVRKYRIFLRENEEGYEMTEIKHRRDIRYV